MFVKSNVRSAIKENPSPAIPYSYWILAALRLALACIPQNGYIHPDEFFQTMEPITGNIMNVEVRHCWEFNATFPLRNIALSQLTIGFPLVILKIIDGVVRNFYNIHLRTPYFIIVFPRLFYCLLSFITDYCLYKVCRLYGQNYKNRLLTLASSHVMLVYATRTFSNSLELILSSILIWLVADCMLKSDSIIYHNEFLGNKYEKSKDVVEKVNIYKLRKSLPAHSLTKCLQMATVVAVGIFNRPTFIGFAFPPIFFWLIRGLGTKYIGFKDFHIRILSFTLSMLPTICFLIIVDSFYYGYLTSGEIMYLDVSIQNFVVTPLNFLKYNLLSDNLAEHGLHPRWLHVAVNIPVLFNVLGMAAIVSIIKMLYRLSKGSYGSLPRVQSITGLMTFTMAAPVAILSLFPHQEPRFLIPVIFPIVFLFTNVLQQTDSNSVYVKKLKTYAFIIWCFCNIFLTVIFGFIHQGGIYSVGKHFHSELRAKPRATTIHLVTSHMYDIPQSLFLTESTTQLRLNRATNQKYYLSKQMFLYEQGSKPLEDVLRLVKEIWQINNANSKHSFRLYIVLPSSLKPELGQAWFQANATALALKEETQFYPHLSTEAFPYLPKSNDQTCFYEGHSLSDVSWRLDLTLIERVKCFIKQFSLVLYKVDVSSYLTIDKFNAEKKI